MSGPGLTVLNERSGDVQTGAPPRECTALTMPIDPQDVETYREMLQIALAQLHEATQKCAALAARCHALQDEIRRSLRQFGP